MISKNILNIFIIMALPNITLGQRDFCLGEQMPCGVMDCDLHGVCECCEGLKCSQFFEGYCLRDCLLEGDMCGSIHCGSGKQCRCCDNMRCSNPFTGVCERECQWHRQPCGKENCKEENCDCCPGLVCAGRPSFDAWCAEPQDGSSTINEK